MYGRVVAAPQLSDVPKQRLITPSIISEKLTAVGYECHFIGKGHLGYQTTDHLMVNRGFKSHAGYLFGMESYYYGNHSKCSGDVCFTKDFWIDELPGDDRIDPGYLEQGRIKIEEDERTAGRASPREVCIAIKSRLPVYS